MSIDATLGPLIRGEEQDATTVIDESCPACACETPHEVFVHLFVESQGEENAAFSREPYRISVCRRCGYETVERMGGG